MRILLVTVSDLLAPTFQICLNLENDYCAIVVDDVQAAKKILVPHGCPEEKIFPFYDLKECVENFYFDVLLFVADGRLFWGDLPKDFLKYGVPQNKIVHMDLTSMNVENAFLMEHALRYFREHSGEFEMFSTGISYIEKCMDAKKFKRPLFNLGRGSQDLYFDCQIAKFVLSDTGGGGAIKYALIGLAPYSFHYDESKTYTYRYRLLQYAIAFSDIHNFWLPIDEYKNLLRKSFFNCRLEIEDKNFDTNNVFFAKFERKTELFSRLNVREGAESWNDKNYPETREENIKILDDYLTLCEENNVTPIIFLPPMTEGYMKYFSRQKLDEFYYLVGTAIKKHPGTKFFDGWQLPGFTDDDFYDSSHLNLQGAAKFSAMFNEFIEGLEKNST